MARGVASIVAHPPHIRPASPHYQVSRKDADQVTGTLKWKQLWLTTLLVPLAIGIVIALIVISNTHDREPGRWPQC